MKDAQYENARRTARRRTAGPGTLRPTTAPPWPPLPRCIHLPPHRHGPRSGTAARPRPRRGDTAALFPGSGIRALAVLVAVRGTSCTLGAARQLLLLPGSAPTADTPAPRPQRRRSLGLAGPLVRSGTRQPRRG